MDKCKSFSCCCEHDSLNCHVCGVGPLCNDCFGVHLLHEHPEEVDENKPVDKWVVRFAVHSFKTKEVLFTGEVIVTAEDKEQALKVGIPFAEVCLKIPKVYVIPEYVEAF